MKQIVTEGIGVVGFGALASGLYGEFGLPVALMVGGGLMMAGAWLAAKRAGK